MMYCFMCLYNDGIVYVRQTIGNLPYSKIKWITFHLSRYVFPMSQSYVSENFIQLGDTAVSVVVTVTRLVSGKMECVFSEVTI